MALEQGKRMKESAVETVEIGKSISKNGTNLLIGIFFLTILIVVTTIRITVGPIKRVVE